MTLDEAIKHCHEVADKNCDECSQQIYLKAGSYTYIDFCSFGERRNTK